MKFSSPIIVLAAISGASSLAVPRNLQSIDGVFAKVQADIDDLKNAVKGLTKNAEEMTKASEKLTADLRSGIETVKASDHLDLRDALSMLPPVKDLKMHAQTLVDSLKQKKTQIQSQHLCDAVRQHISSISTESKGLILAIVVKVPESTVGIARKQGKGFTDVLDEAKEAFSEKNCVRT